MALQKASSGTFSDSFVCIVSYVILEHTFRDLKRTSVATSRVRFPCLYVHACIYSSKPSVLICSVPLCHHTTVTPCHVIGEQVTSLRGRLALIKRAKEDTF